MRVDLRKNRGKVRRDKSALTRHAREGDVKAEDAAQVESVRAKGSLSRKRTVVIRDEADAEDTGERASGLVVAVRGWAVEVESGDALWVCVVRRLLRTRLIEARTPIAVGDRVRFRPAVVGGEIARVELGDAELPQGIIEDVEPRRTTLLRKYARRVQVIAANVDVGVITVAAEQPTLRPHLIDRYLVAIGKGEMRPVICINKADLDRDGAAAVVAERYRAIDYPVVLSSVPERRGLNELRDLIQNVTSVFVGPSGTGKSSLLNVLAPDFSLRVGTLTDLCRGRHTTTTARLLAWPFGGHVVDTPGMRQFEPADVAAGELEALFVEFVELIRDCRFHNCTHTHERGCAVKAAAAEGRIAPERYESYCKMFAECAARPDY